MEALFRKKKMIKEQRDVESLSVEPGAATNRKPLQLSFAHMRFMTLCTAVKKTKSGHAHKPMCVRVSYNV